MDICTSIIQLSVYCLDTRIYQESYHISIAYYQAKTLVPNILSQNKLFYYIVTPNGTCTVTTIYIGGLHLLPTISKLITKISNHKKNLTKLDILLSNKIFGFVFFIAVAGI